MGGMVQSPQEQGATWTLEERGTCRLDSEEEGMKQTPQAEGNRGHDLKHW